MAGWNPTSEVRPGHSLADTPHDADGTFYPKTRGLDRPGGIVFSSKSSPSPGDLASLPGSKETTWFSSIPATRFPPQLSPV